ncbi:MAG TPA: PAS domain-containing protein [Flavisolibacter sp.]|nr:PAS domain-containing protein [Flavisolibacter sp.]
MKIARTVKEKPANFRFRFHYKKDFPLLPTTKAYDLVLFSQSPKSSALLKEIRRFRKEAPATLLFYLSDSTSETFAVQLWQAGIYRYLLPGQLSGLSRLIKKAKNEQNKNQAGKEARPKRDPLSSLLENIKDGVLILDDKWMIVYTNKAASMMLKRKPSQLNGKQIWKEFPEAVDQPFYHAYHKALKTQEKQQVVNYSPVLNRWLEAVIYPTPNRLSIYFHDITREREASQKAQESESQYRDVLERITDGFIALDRNFCYIYANQKVGELVQRDPATLIGKNVWEEFPEAVGSTTYKAFQTAMNEQRFISNIDYYEPLNLWQENYIYPSPEGLSIFIRDISERKKLEKELFERERRQQIEITATALSAQEKERTHIGQELHDNVNQIITATTLTLNLAKDDPKQARPLLLKSIENLERALAENRKLAHELVTPDFTDQNFLHQLTRLVTPMLETKGIKVHLQQPDFNEALLDESRKLAAYRIAQEQCTNIIKYSGAQSVLFFLTTAENVFEMLISDDGIGMAPNVSEKGIGLKNMQGRLRLFNGDLHIETEPGKGFSLRILIPINRN